MLSYSKQRHRVPISSDGKNEEHRNRRQDRLVITQICDQKTVLASRNKYHIYLVLMTYSSSCKTLTHLGAYFKVRVEFYYYDRSALA